MKHDMKYDGIFAIADWWATYCEAAGVTVPLDAKTGPFPEDSISQWKSLQQVARGHAMLATAESDGAEGGREGAREGGRKGGSAVYGSSAIVYPRTEMVHMVHSPQYYPGNCSIDHWINSTHYALSL
jgi:hypothetical protein